MAKWAVKSRAAGTNSRLRWRDVELGRACKTIKDSCFDVLGRADEGRGRTGGLGEFKRPWQWGPAEAGESGGVIACAVTHGSQPNEHYLLTHVRQSPQCQTLGKHPRSSRGSALGKRTLGRPERPNGAIYRCLSI